MIKPNYCKECKVEISINAVRCRKCYRKNMTQYETKYCVDCNKTINHYNVRCQKCYYKQHKHSEETKRKIGLKSKGRTQPNKGVHYYNECNDCKKEISLRAKLCKSCSSKKRICSEEIRNKMGISQKRAYIEGRKKIWNKGLTKETDRRIKKQAENLFRHPVSEETRLKQKKAKLGKKLLREHKEKISYKLIGHSVSSGTKEKIRKAQMGEKGHNWKGGISFEPYDKNFNNTFRRQIRKRDNHICMLCRIHQEKLKKSLDIHHINYDKTLSIPQNCISLCYLCHAKTGFNRKYWINFFQSLLADKYQYMENCQVIIGMGSGKNE